MNRALFTLTDKQELAQGIYMLTLRGDTSGITRAGQFVNVAASGKYLRRPISIHDISNGGLKLVVGVKGDGTRSICNCALGEQLDLLVGLGNGYDITKHGTNNVIIGGGLGVPPLFLLARQLVERGIIPRVILGFRNASQVILKEQFEKLNVPLLLCTDDGSYGAKGNVCDLLRDVTADYLYACGPRPMLKALQQCRQIPNGQISIEERMGCGVGICMGCVCSTRHGRKTVCDDGPVFELGEVLW